MLVGQWSWPLAHSARMPLQNNGLGWENDRQYILMEGWLLVSFSISSSSIQAPAAKGRLLASMLGNRA